MNNTPCYSHSHGHVLVCMAKNYSHFTCTSEQVAGQKLAFIELALFPIFRAHISVHLHVENGHDSKHTFRLIISLPSTTPTTLAANVGPLLLSLPAPETKLSPQPGLLGWILDPRLQSKQVLTNVLRIPCI